MRRESILIQEPATGRDVSVWGGDPTLFDCPKDVPPVEPTAPRGDSGARGSTDELAPPPIGAEFSPDILHEFPDSTEYPFNDAEVYGNYMPVRTGSLRAHDIATRE